MKAVRRGEAMTLALSFIFFLFLLASYYVLRPVRDGSVAFLGTDELKYLNLVVLFVMMALTPVFGGLMARVPRRKLLPAIYGFAIVNLIGFAIGFEQDAWLPTVTRIFFVWVMVFSMFVISVFWSFMADIWNEEQGRRLFGFIAAGGSTGGLIGPIVARQFVARIGNGGLVLVAASLLCGALICLIVLSRRQLESAKKNVDQPKAAFGGSSLQSLKLVFSSPFLLSIAGLVCIGAVVAQFAYIETGRLARAMYTTPAELTAFFAGVDSWTNVVTLCFQTMIVGFLTTRFGIRAPLIGVAAIACLSFVPIALAPTLGVFTVTNIIRRSTEYGLSKPGRDMLYTVSTPQEKYLAKNVIDTLIYRGSDSLGNWLHTLIFAFGISLAGMGWISVALVGVSVFIALGAVKGYYARGGK